jgi:hypothetical protein
MRSRWTGAEIGAEMQLGSEEEDSKEQSENDNTAAFCLHVQRKKKLREERLPGQGKRHAAWRGQQGGNPWGTEQAVTGLTCPKRIQTVGP